MEASYKMYGWSEKSMEEGIRVIEEVLFNNKDRQLSFAEILQKVDNRVGEIRVRAVLYLMKDQDKIRMRRFAHNRCTFQLK